MNEDVLLNSFDKTIKKIQIPYDIEAKSIEDTNTMINNHLLEKEGLESNLQFSIKIKPMSYADERKYYTCVDSAYKIYTNMLDQKNPPSKTFAWCVANIAMFNWFFKSLTGYILTGREVERAVDYAIRAPYQFIITNCLSGLIQGLAVGLGGYGLTQATGMPMFQYQTIGFYIISVIINLIKASIKIRKNNLIELQSIRPTG